MMDATFRMCDLRFLNRVSNEGSGFQVGLAFPNSFFPLELGCPSRVSNQVCGFQSSVSRVGLVFASGVCS